MMPPDLDLVNIFIDIPLSYVMPADDGLSCAQYQTWISEDQREINKMVLKAHTYVPAIDL